ncbi:NAD(P)-binding domain-containing protein [Deinococcus marmoris]|uniref:NAD(P)-binding domain-containing protein n=1 Tax=Deinococcus marmoris TaxID=249408 RepID=UPI0009F8906A
MSNSRGPDTLRDLAERLGHGVTAYSDEDAAHFGELVIETVPFGHHNGLPTAQLAGKIAIDTTDCDPEREVRLAWAACQRAHSWPSPGQCACGQGVQYRPSGRSGEPG